MTRERCKELLPVLEAWAEGKEIEVRIPNSNVPERRLWRTLQGFCTDFECPGTEWRIKPTPRGGWMCLTCRLHFDALTSELVHNQDCLVPNVVQWVEVLP